LVDGGISADEAFRLASAPLNELGAIVAHVSDRDVLSPEVEIMPAPQISEALLRVAGNVGPLALPAALRAGIAGVILGDELDRLKDKPTDIYRPIRTFTHQNYDPSAGPVDRSVFIYDNFGGQADNGVNYYDHRILSSTRLDPSLGSIVFAMPETSALEIAHRDDPGAPSAYPFGGKDVGPIGMEVRYPGPVRETLGFYLASELSDEGLVVSLSHGYWNAVLGVEGVAKVLWLHRYAREHAARSVDS
jgi:hypothetical protein